MKKGIIVLIIVLSLLLVGIGGYYAYNNLFKDEKINDNNEKPNDINPQKGFYVYEESNYTEEYNSHKISCYYFRGVDYNESIDLLNNYSYDELLEIYDYVELVGVYECKGEEYWCREYAADKYGYADQKRPVALLQLIPIDSNGEDDWDNSRAFLYDFKENKKISEEYQWFTNIYENNSTTSFTVELGGKKGVIDINGKILEPLTVKQ